MATATVGQIEREKKGGWYERHKGHVAAYQQRHRVAAQDIGEIPKPENPKRRRKCKADFRAFCTTYFPSAFVLPFSADHKADIEKIQRAVMHGGRFAWAMPRGNGKTTLCEIAAVWALLYGHRRYLVLIAADLSLAVQMLDSIKQEFEHNDALLADFPEVCFPIRCLEGSPHRVRGQHSGGVRTLIGWSADEVVFPTVKRSKVSGSILQVAGITGQIRGRKYKRADGTQIRPDIVILDDCQTDESSNSPSQCLTRERLIKGAVLGLAGPGKKIAAVMPCTVIRPGDLADRILSRELNPDWQGERRKMLYQFPQNMELWKRYRELREDSFRRDGRGEDATAFYVEHREEMDRGAVVAWEHRKLPEEVSAIQHAMNLYFQDEPAFYAEYQNDPQPLELETTIKLTSKGICERINRRPRGVIGIEETKLTFMIDVQQEALFYLALAVAEDFTGSVVEWGCFPDQRSDYFTLNNLRVKLSDVIRSSGLEGNLYGGLDILTQRILGKAWKREDGAEVTVDRCLIDANWGASTNTVYKFCAESQFKNILIPSHGQFFGAGSVPMDQYRKTPGDRVGNNWRIPNVRGKRAVRHAVFDTNYWKAFVCHRLLAPMGERGAWSLFGDDAEKHRLFADHCVSEYAVRTIGRGREVDEFKAKPEKFDNHLWDCVVGAAVAASIEGCELDSIRQDRHKRAAGQRVSFAKLQRERRGNG